MFRAKTRHAGGAPGTPLVVEIERLLHRSRQGSLQAGTKGSQLLVLRCRGLLILQLEVHVSALVQGRCHQRAQRVGIGQVVPPFMHVFEQRAAESAFDCLRTIPASICSAGELLTGNPTRLTPV